MRRSRPPPPKERKTGNHQYPRGNPPPPRRTANASPQASETAVNSRHMHRGETSGRRSRPRSIPEYLHKWKPPFQPGGNKSTQRQPDSQGETWRARKRKPIQFHASLRVKTVTTGGTEKRPKEGGGTTGLTMSKTRPRHQPRTSHQFQETSYARF